MGNEAYVCPTCGETVAALSILSLPEHEIKQLCFPCCISEFEKWGDKNFPEGTEKGALIIRSEDLREDGTGQEDKP